MPCLEFQLRRCKQLQLVKYLLQCFVLLILVQLARLFQEHVTVVQDQLVAQLPVVAADLAQLLQPHLPGHRPDLLTRLLLPLAQLRHSVILEE